MKILNGHSLSASDGFRPERMALNLEERNSTATVTVPAGMDGLPVGTWLQDETEPGSGIVWRVKTVDRQYDRDQQNVQLEHVINTLRDRIMFGEVTPAMMSGTLGATTCTAKQAFQYILGQQSDWVLGDFAYNVSNPYNFNGDDLFSALETVSSSLADCIWEYSFASYPFTLHVRQLSNSVESEMRMSRNIGTMRVTVDRNGMFTRFYPIGKNNMTIAGGYVSRNESTWGIISKVETDQSKTTEAELTAWANERLSRHAEPLVTGTITGLELSQSTGESLDHFVIGRKCRVPLPEYGTTITERVTKLSWRDKVSEPESVTVTLANKLADVASILRQQTASGSRSGRTGAKNAEEDHAWFVDTSDHVAMVAEAVAGKDASGKPNWSRVSELTVDGSGIDARVTVTEGDIVTHESRITATEEAIEQEVTDRTSADTTLSGRITVNANKVGMVVETKNGQNVIKSASIVAAINADGSSEASIAADHVIITGATKINGTFEIDDNGYLKVKKTAIFQGNLTLTTSGSEVTAPNYTLNSGGKIRFVGGNTGEYYDLTCTLLKGMIKSFDVTGNVLTLTPWYGDPVTFSKAVTLSAAWGSGDDLGKYVVKAYENSEVMATHKYDPPMRLMGGSTPTTSFSAEITSTSGSTTVAQKSVYGYLLLKGTTSGTYVEVNTSSAGTGSTVAMISVGTLYTDGQDSVTLKNPYWNTVQSITTMRTVTVETNGRPTMLSKSQTIAMDVGTWSSGLIPVYVKDTNTSGSVVAQTSVSIPNVTGVTLGAVSSGTTYNCGVDIGGTTKPSTVDCADAVTAGKNAVTLANPYWNNVTSTTTMRTVTVETSGRPTKLTKSKTVYLTTDNAWSGGMMGIYIRDGSTSGTAVATSSVSIPNVTSVSLGSISSGAVCNCGVTIGGITKQSTVDCSGKLYAKTGTNKVTANGTITPPSGYIGFSSVEVDVAGGGGGAITWDAYDPNDNVHNTAHSGSNTSTIMLNGRNFNTAGPDNVATAGRSYWYVQIGSESGTILCKDYIDIPAITATCSNPSQGTYLITVKCGGKTKQFYLELTNSYSGGYNFSEA